MQASSKARRGGLACRFPGFWESKKLSDCYGGKVIGRWSVRVWEKDFEELDRDGTCLSVAGLRTVDGLCEEESESVSIERVVVRSDEVGEH